MSSGPRSSSKLGYETPDPFLLTAYRRAVCSVEKKQGVCMTTVHYLTLAVCRQIYLI